MPRIPIRLYGDPVLQTKAVTVEKVTDAHRRLAADMFETMEAAKGVGLAANQVGVLERLFVLRVPGEEEEDPPFRAVLINPEITSRSGEQTDEEGCLSFPGLYFDVRRSGHVTARALDLEGKPFEIEAEGYLARAIQHELDHLDGVLYIDRISSVKRGLLRNKLGEIRARGAAGETRNVETDEDSEEDS
jgi:peptide deformylase